jgi:hypothetical protein
MRFLMAFRLLLLGLWLGAAVFFVAVAQSAFAMLPTHELAGNLVSQVFAVLNYSGIGISFIVVITSFIVPAGINQVALWFERIFLIVFGLACAVAQFVISWWMLLLRTQMGRPIDEVAADDPLRIQFNSLHQYSSWIMLTALAAAFLAFVIIATRTPPGAKKTSFDNIDFQKQFKI